eukprot:gene3055-27773_t
MLRLRSPKNHGALRRCASVLVGQSATSSDVLEVKKSKFTATVYNAETHREASDLALAHRAAVDRRVGHVCWGWRGGGGGEGSTDDGEPAGTAGRPIVAAIEAADVVDAVVVVERIYGGTNLGTGGLARAYGTAARMCLEVAELKTLRTDLVTIVAVAPPSTAGAVFAVAARLERAKTGGVDTSVNYNLDPPTAADASAQFIKAGATIS